MNILLIAVGSRGDIEPFIAVAQLLQKKGHTVTCALPEQLSFIAKEGNIPYKALSPLFLELLESKEGKIVMGRQGNFFQRLKALFTLAKQSLPAQKALVQDQYKFVREINPDQIIYHTKATYPVLWSIYSGKKTILLSPVPYLHYTKGHAHIGFQGNFGSLINKCTYWIADFGLASTIRMSAKWLKLNVPSYKKTQKALRDMTTIYTISPSLVPKPDHWPEHLHILGYQERQIPTEWTMPENLQKFLNSHEKVLFVSFGSMTNADPTRKTSILLSILEKLNIPAVINIAGGGLQKPETYNKKLFFFTHKVPYSKIFPHVYACIHHGGAGTTHMSLRNGCPTMIIPHIIDQYLWNDIVYAHGAGPKGVSINNFHTSQLSKKILDLFENTSYLEKVSQLKSTMEQEHFNDAICKIIEN